MWVKGFDNKTQRQELKRFADTVIVKVSFFKLNVFTYYIGESSFTQFFQTFEVTRNGKSLAAEGKKSCLEVSD